jgi:hypothetical protein
VFPVLAWFWLRNPIFTTAAATTTRECSEKLPLPGISVNCLQFLLLLKVFRPQRSNELILGCQIFMILLGLRCELIYMGFWTQVPHFLTGDRMVFLLNSQYRDNENIFLFTKENHDVINSAGTHWNCKLIATDQWKACVHGVCSPCPVYFQISGYYSYCHL